MNRQAGYPIAGMLLTILISGCGESGPEVASVTGVVKMDGNPLANAVISFEPTGPGRQSVGNTDESGYYSLQYTADRSGALPGTHTVRISTKQWVYDEEAGDDRPMPERVPPQYNTESTLTATVESGGSEVNFDIKSDGFKAKEPDPEEFE